MKSRNFFIVLLPSILLTLAHKMGALNFECGPHGRFEYCINENPGCIMGCHCHPGYYFDPKAKICKPNDKLRQSYRQEYNDLAPTPTPFSTAKFSPTPTESDVIDSNVDDIAKDADDLGDWLYSEFFKARDNQVINKTGEENTPNRQSGADGPKTRRSRRKHTKKLPKKKKRHSEKEGLRKKLLRISEDDSLFDSSSESSSSSSSSSSTSTSSSSTESESSRSRKRSKDLGHRKIHPSLPSFIFLPNMETPYFPPFGLLPPPIMPMYPLIPVPPMMPSISSK